MYSTGAAVPKASPEPKICQVKIKPKSSRETTESRQAKMKVLARNETTSFRCRKTADTESIYKSLL